MWKYTKICCIITLIIISHKEVKRVAKYTDDEIRKMQKITIKIAADYLGIAPMMLSMGMRNNLLPIGFAVNNKDRYIGLEHMRRLWRFLRSKSLAFHG